MLHLSNPNIGVPGSFKYRINALAEKAPRLAWVGPHHAFNDLYNDVANRCAANGVSVPSRAEVEDQVCQGLPSGYCLTEDNIPVIGPGMQMGASTFIQGTKTLFFWWFHGKRRATREEAMRRAYICNICPWHKPLEGCTGCQMKEVRGLINQIIEGEPYPTDSLLQLCGVCGCSLIAKTRMLKEDLLPHMPESQKAQLWEKCWLKEE